MPDSTRTDLPPSEEPAAAASAGAPLPLDESARLWALGNYAILDTPPEAAFDRAARVAARLFRAPIALVSLVDRDRQWFKACVGMDVRETPRRLSFCAHAILGPDVFVIPDASRDPRFADNALVTGEPHIRFYAGAPLVAPDGSRLGTLCVIDSQPRDPAEFREADWDALRALASGVVSEMELRLAAGRLAEENARRRAVEEALRRSRDEERALLAALPDAVFVVDRDGRFHKAASDAALPGHPGPDHVGHLARDLFPAEAAAGLAACVRAALDEGRPAHLEYVLEVGGRPAFFEGTAAPLDARLAVWVARDQTERRRAEDALRHGRDRIEERHLSRTREMSEANRALEEQARALHNAQGRRDDLAHSLRAILEGVPELLSAPDLDEVCRRAVEWARERLGLERCGLFVLEDEARGLWRGTYGTGLDGRTTREDHFLSALEWSGWESDPFALARPDAPARWMVREGVALPNASRDGGGVRGWQAVTPLISESGVRGVLFNDAAISGAPFDPARQDLAAVFCSLVAGVLAKRRAQEAARAQEASFHFLADAVPDFVWTTDGAGHNDFCNRRFTEFLGEPPGALLGDGWLHALHPDDRERARATWERCVREGAPYEIEYRFRDRQSGGWRWFLGRAEPQRDATGKIVKWFGTCSDIHARKEAEHALRQAVDALQMAHDALDRRVHERTRELAHANHALVLEVEQREAAQARLSRLNDELRRSNDELQQFAYVASHDLQEPLRAVASYVQLLERRYGDQLDQPAREYIGYAVDGAKRMQRLIHDLLAFARVGSRGGEPEPVPLEEALGKATRLLAHAIAESGARITHGPLPTVRADRVQMVQLLQNLLANALRYRSDDAPRVHLSAEKRAAPGGEEWVLCVRDNGIGIAPEYFERIFVIFQRLQAGTDGTGLGLALCKKIVERHGGRIWVESQEGHGAAFFWTLPIIEADAGE